MHNTDEMKRLAERGLLPKDVTRLVEAIGLDDVPDVAIAEIRQVIGLTEGQNLVNRIAAKMLGTIKEANRLAGLEEADAAAQQHVADNGPPVPDDDEAEAKRFQLFLDGKGLTADEYNALNQSERAILEDEYSKWEAPAEPEPSDSDNFVKWLLEKKQLTTQEFKAQSEREQDVIRREYLPQLDQDNDGRPGGSKPDEETQPAGLKAPLAAGQAADASRSVDPEPPVQPTPAPKRAPAKRRTKSKGGKARTPKAGAAAS